jgi:peptidoglycan/LPS O-acetylase OafA/YrhL
MVVVFARNSFSRHFSSSVFRDLSLCLFLSLLSAGLITIYPRMIFFLPGASCALLYSSTVSFHLAFRRFHSKLYSWFVCASIFSFFFFAFRSRVFLFNPFALFFDGLSSSSCFLKVSLIVSLFLSSYSLYFFFGALLASHEVRLASNPSFQSAPTDIISRFLNMRIFQVLGILSFSIYLFHPCALKLIEPYKLAAMFSFFLSLLLTLSGSFILFLLFERPFTKGLLRS